MNHARGSTSLSTRLLVGVTVPVQAKWLFSCCWSLGSIGVTTVQMMLLVEVLTTKSPWDMATVMACWLGGMCIAHALRLLLGEQDARERRWGCGVLICAVVSWWASRTPLAAPPLLVLDLLAGFLGLASTLWLKAPRRHWPEAYEGMVQGSLLLGTLVALTLVRLPPPLHVVAVSFAGLFLLPLLALDGLPRAVTCFPDPHLLERREKGTTTDRYWRTVTRTWSLEETADAAWQYLQPRLTGLGVGILLLTLGGTVFPSFAVTHTSTLLLSLLVVQGVALGTCACWLRENRAWLGGLDRLIPRPYRSRSTMVALLALLATAAAMTLFTQPIVPWLYLAELVFTAGVFLWLRVHPRLHPGVLANALAQRQHTFPRPFLPPNDPDLATKRALEDRCQRCFSLAEAIFSVPLVLATGLTIEHEQGDTLPLMALACLFAGLCALEYRSCKRKKSPRCLEPHDDECREENAALNRAAPSSLTRKDYAHR